jgi:soluble lytic murein transglycosylase-like protein
VSSPISSVLITPAEAAAMTRASQIEALASRSAEGADAPSGTSFAAALEAAQEGSPGQELEAEQMSSLVPEAMPSSQAEPVGGGLAAVESELASQSAGNAASPGQSSAISASPTYAAYSGLGSSYSPTAYPQTTSLPSVSTPSSATTAAPQGASAYEPLIEQAAARNGVEPAVLYGLIEQESGFNPSAQSSAGAAGLTQLMPSTAASLGVTEPLNPTQSIEGGARLLGELMRQFHGNVQYALAAYNAGAGAVDQYGGIPPYPETEAYVTKVLANAQSYRQRAQPQISA